MSPVATDHATSVRGLAMRVSALSATGVPLTGTSGSVWVQGQFIQAQFTPVYNSGSDDFTLAADGSGCQILKTPDILKYVNVHIELCNPEPELIALLAGGSTLTPPPGTGAVTGYASQQVGTLSGGGGGNGVGVELWSYAYVAGRPASVNPYWQWVLPLCTLWLNGDRQLSNGFTSTIIEGFCFGNPNFAPGGGTPTFPFATDKPYAQARVPSLPTILNGFVS